MSQSEIVSFSLGIVKTADKHQKTADKHRTVNILCVHRKNQLNMVRSKLFVNPSFIGTNYTNVVFTNLFANRMFASIYAALR